MRSARRHSSRPPSDGLRRDDGPFSKARRAVRTARSTLGAPLDEQWGDDAARHWIVDREGVARLGGDPLTVDEHLSRA
jgi:hypothetical protein